MSIIGAVKLREYLVVKEGAELVRDLKPTVDVPESVEHEDGERRHWHVMLDPGVLGLYCSQ